MATPPPMGVQEVFGIGLETSGFAAGSETPNVFFRPVSNSIRIKDPLLPLASPTGGQTDLTPTRSFRGTPDVSGTVVIEAEYDDLGILLANAIATPVYDADNPVTGAHLHTFTLPFATPTSTPTSLVTSSIRGLAGEDIETRGSMINAIEISGSGNRIVTVSMDIIAQSGLVANDSIGSLSAAPFIEFHDSVFRADFSGAEATVTSADDQGSGAEPADWSLRVENNYRRQQAANGTRGDRPYTWMNLRPVTLSVTRDFFDDNFFDLYNATSGSGTFGSFAIYCESDEFVTGSTPYSLLMQINAGAVVNANAEYGGGHDIIPERIEIRAGYGGSLAPLVVSLNNGTTDSGTGNYYGN